MAVAEEAVAEQAPARVFADGAGQVGLEVAVVVAEGEVVAVLIVLVKS